MIPNKTRVAAEARALTMALAIAPKVGWRFDRGPLPATSFAQFLYVEAAQLLLVPTSDALIVSSAGTEITLAMATWARRETVWSQPLTLWLGDGGQAWLVPAMADSDLLGFRLSNALHHAAATPWKFASERQAGLNRAAAWMRSVVEG